jgi:hypothetical protein
MEEYKKKNGRHEEMRKQLLLVTKLVRAGGEVMT